MRTLIKAAEKVGIKMPHNMRHFYFNHVIWPRQVRERASLYEEARKIYAEKESDTTEQAEKKDGGFTPSDMRVEPVFPGKTDGFLTLPESYMALVGRVAEEVDDAMQYTKNLSFVRNPVNVEEDMPELLADMPEYKELRLAKWALNDVSLLPTLEDVCNVLVPLIERHIYHSYVSVDIPYVYFLRESHVGRSSSLIWHTDNHHVDSLKVMIYLHDTDGDLGAFEYLVDAEGVPMYVPVRRPEIYPKGRITEEEIAAFEREGYRRVKVVGPKGTTIFFSENMVHRGNIPEHGTRKVIVLQFKPSLTKQTTFITGQ